MTPQPRYQELARRYGPVVAQAGTCACHVHVGVPSRDLGVQVLARLRPWLAPLMAITANSPIAAGRDTGWASWRYVLQSRWPTATAPAAWPDAAAYDAAVRRLIARGAALDERNVYFWARLSPRYPTVEVRVADACLDAGTAVLVAGLTRALVATALAEARRGTPVPAAPARQVAAALAAAARHGLAGARANPVTGQPAATAVLRARLLEHVSPALRDHGDTEAITGLLRRLDDRGTGADRQRALFTSGLSTPAVITALARATLSGYKRPPAARPRPGQCRPALVAGLGLPAPGTVVLLTVITFGPACWILRNDARTNRVSRMLAWRGNGGCLTPDGAVSPSRAPARRPGRRTGLERGSTASATSRTVSVSMTMFSGLHTADDLPGVRERAVQAGPAPALAVSRAGSSRCGPWRV